MYFLGKVTALGVLCCFALLFVCLTLLAFFFLPSHLSMKHVRTSKLFLYIIPRVIIRFLVRYNTDVLHVLYIHITIIL